MKDHSKPHHPSARHYSLDIKHLGVAHCLAKTVPIAAKLNDQMSEDAPRLPDLSVRPQPNVPTLGILSSSQVGFNDLPTELRLQIFKEALTGPSGTLAFSGFSRYCSRKNHGVATSLLATCSSINTAATPILYTSNVFLIEVEACTNINLDISFSTLPMHVLPRIQHAFVVLDTRRTLPYLSLGKQVRGNFGQMSGLKSLGISIITPSRYLNDRIKWEGMLWTVVESVPEGCHLRFRATSNAEKDFVSRFTDSEGGSFTASQCVEVAEEVLTKAMEKIRALQSSKSG